MLTKMATSNEPSSLRSLRNNVIKSILLCQKNNHNYHYYANNYISSYDSTVLDNIKMYFIGKKHFNDILDDISTLKKLYYKDLKKIGKKVRCKLLLKELLDAMTNFFKEAIVINRNIDSVRDYIYVISRGSGQKFANYRPHLTNNTYGFFLEILINQVIENHPAILYGFNEVTRENWTFKRPELDDVLNGSSHPQLFQPFNASTIDSTNNVIYTTNNRLTVVQKYYNPTTNLTETRSVCPVQTWWLYLLGYPVRKSNKLSWQFNKSKELSWRFNNSTNFMSNTINFATTAKINSVGLLHGSDEWLLCYQKIILEFATILYQEIKSMKQLLLVEDQQGLEENLQFLLNKLSLLAHSKPLKIYYPHCLPGNNDNDLSQNLGNNHSLTVNNTINHNLLKNSSTFFNSSNHNWHNNQSETKQDDHDHRFYFNNQ